MTPYQKELAVKFNAETHMELERAGHIDKDTPVSRKGYKHCWLTTGNLNKAGMVQVQFDDGGRTWFSASSVWFGERP